MNMAWASAGVSPVSRVRQPSSSSKPPSAPRIARTGTPEAESSSMSRSTVRTETSSFSASVVALSRPWACRSIRSERSRPERMRKDTENT